MSRKEGPMGGSLLITEVNGKRLAEPQLIYGTPKLAYPYRSTEATDYVDFASFSAAKMCFFGNKWNGTNILFFKYKDADGNAFISGKTKGSAFLSDCMPLISSSLLNFIVLAQYGAFLSLTTRALKLRKVAGALIVRNLPPLLRHLASPDVQSKSFELCGTEEPHLVAYDFPLELKPLYILNTLTFRRNNCYDYHYHSIMLDFAYLLPTWTAALRQPSARTRRTSGRCPSRPRRWPKSVAICSRRC